MRAFGRQIYNMLDRSKKGVTVYYAYFSRACFLRNIGRGISGEASQEFIFVDLLYMYVQRFFYLLYLFHLKKSTSKLASD